MTAPERPKDWDEVERLFHRARLLPPDEHAHFVANIPDSEIRAEVASLLAVDSRRDTPTIDEIIGDAARAALDEPEPGRMCGHFRIVAVAGRGGMGAVYRAEDVLLGRQVALKLLPAAFDHDADRLRRFDLEARAAAALNHPNIMAIYEVGSAGGHRFIAAEYVEGETLSERLGRGALRMNEAVGLAEQIIEGLAAAHDKGVVHRDLKPANIKIQPDGTVKVLDFGLAKVAQPISSSDHAGSMDSAQATRSGTAIGTPAYMSPEQARGLPVDHRTDIWAFGAVVFEMVTGRRLFGRDTVSDTLAAVLTEHPDLLALPSRLRAVVGPCLAKDVRQRWQDIRDVRIALTQELSEPLPPSRRRSLTLPIAAVIAAVAVVSAALVIRRQPDAAPQPLVRLNVDLGPEANLANDRGQHTIAMSPDGTRIAFGCKAPAGDLRICTRQLDQGSTAALAGTDGVQTIFFSPDGEWIGFTARGKLKKVSVRGGSPLTLCDAPFDRGAAWTDSGFIVASLSSETGLMRIPEGGGTPQPLTTFNPGEIRHRWPQFLPGANAVLFTASSEAGHYENGSLDVVSLDTGERKTLHRGGYYGRYLPSGHLIYMHLATLFAARMDIGRLALAGTPVPVLDDVASRPSDGGADFEFSQLGTFVYLSGRSRGPRTVQWLHKSGRLEPLALAPGAYDALRLSPDGTRLALVIQDAGPGVWVYHLQRGALARLTFGGANEAPVWSRAGQHLAYRSGQSSGTFWMRADASGDAQRLTPRAFNAWPNSVSADGKRLAVEIMNADAQADIWTLELEHADADHPRAAQPEGFLRTAASEIQPAFSPDGQWLAYVSNESGSNQIYVRPFPGAGLQIGGKWQISADGGTTPIWSPQGRDLFYISSDRRIMAATYAAKDGVFQADRPARWSDVVIPDGQRVPSIARLIDVTPDGQRFVVLVPSHEAQAPPTRVNVLLNFFDELRRRTAERE